MNANTERRAIIEARHPDHGNNWDSDYVSNQSFSEAEARAYVAKLETCADAGTPDSNGEDWTGWEFRILIDNGNGYGDRVN